MRTLILGATGMLGSAVMRAFLHDDRYDTLGTARSPDRASLLPGAPIVDAQVGNVLDTLRSWPPDVIINCIGIVKQKVASRSQMVYVNSYLPNMVAEWARAQGAYFVHVSTDCVFSGEGKPGGYREHDRPDAGDIYAASKWLGEIGEPGVTLRTSFIGHELPGEKHGLLEWYLSSLSPCDGWMNAWWTGVTADELARLIRDYIIPDRLRGLYHVGGEPIRKAVLLTAISEAYQHPRPVAFKGSPTIDRRLNSERFWTVIGEAPRPLHDQLEEMAHARSRLLPVAPEG